MFDSNAWPAEKYGYWMVHCPEKGPPHCMHGCYQDAVDEARRLASLNPGHRFFVLAAVQLIKNELSVDRMLRPDEPDAIPF